MTAKELAQLVAESDTTFIRYAVADIDGVLRGKLISKEKFLSALQDGINFCNVIFGWDINDECYTNTKVSGWHTGYPDDLSKPDPSTFRLIPWENQRPFILGDFSDGSYLNHVCPRTLLRNVTAKASEMGFNPVFAAEMEWFNFDETPQSWHDKGYQHPLPLTPGMFGYSVLRASNNNEYFSDLAELLLQFNIPLEGLHTETGTGVYEAAITKTDILESADRAVLFKTAVKEIAYQHEIMASFMAKWNPVLPGCSGHIHQSLWDNTGRNLFFDENAEYMMSDLMKHFIAGQLFCLPHILPMYAPTTNSYKRFVKGSWAATTVSWGIENRTTALRVIPHSESSMRVEHRVPGSDTNPYLTMAACLASGLYGIEHKLELSLPATRGNEYKNENSERLPASLYEATERMMKSAIPSELFGEEFANHFIKTREWECMQHQPEDPTWEMKRYFELV
jgi:glutamine synthetase